MFGPAWCDHGAGAHLTTPASWSCSGRASRVVIMLPGRASRCRDHWLGVHL